MGCITKGGDYTKTYILTTCVGGTQVVGSENLWSAYDQLVENSAQYPDLQVSATLVLDAQVGSGIHRVVGPEGILLLDSRQKMVGLIRPVGTDVYQYSIALAKYLCCAEGERWASVLRSVPF